MRKPPETVRKRNRLASLPLLPANRKAFSGSETAPSGGAVFAIFILQINGAVRGEERLGVSFAASVTILPLPTDLPQKSKENVEHSKLE